MLVGPYSLDVLVRVLICKTGVVSLPVSRPVLVSQLPSGHLSNEEISLVTPPAWERDFALLILRRFATIPALGQPRLTASTADGSSTSRGVTTGITSAGSGASAGHSLCVYSSWSFLKCQAYINFHLGLLPSADHHASRSHSHRPHPERLVANQLPTMEQDIFCEHPIARIGTANADVVRRQCIKSALAAHLSSFS